MNTYLKLINKHRGENAFIFGAGPSLWFNMQHPLFAKIHDHGITIVVNSAVLAVPNFDYWVSNDILCRRWSYWKDVINGSGIKVVRDSWEKYKKELDGFLFFHHRPTSEDVINLNDVGLAYCSSIPSSIDLAIQMGCKQIFLLGVDQNDYEGKHHFWQFMDKDKQPVCNPNVQDSWERQREIFDISNKALEALKGFAKHKKVEIYNCSHLSNINMFKQVELCDIREKSEQIKIKK